MTAGKKMDDLEARIFKFLKGQDVETTRAFVRAQHEIKEIKEKQGPTTKDELWTFFKEKFNVELGRTSVCPGHTAQLDLAWEVYSFEVTRVLWVLSRGGGKTSLMAWLDDCQAEHWPGWSSFTIGPGKNQGERKYEHLLPFVVENGVIGGKELDHVARSVQTKTEWKNGSSMEISLGGGVDNANGPRVPRLHRDETELMLDATYKQAGNIPAGRIMRDGRYAPAQIVDTSTMKWANGRIDLQIQDYNKAIEKGERPRMQVRVSCIYEAAAENPTCASVPEDQRRRRLIELDRDPNEICDCSTWISDTWEREEGDDDVDENSEEEARTLQSVCQGRFFRSRGYKAFDDIQTLFLENDRESWTAEQECAEPSREGTYLRSYNHVKHGIKGFCPDPQNGPIYTTVDWGSGDEAAIIWIQILEQDVECKSYVSGLPRIMPAGAEVAFDEVFISGLGNIRLGELLLEKELEYMTEIPGWHVHERYYDNAGLNGKLDWKQKLGIEVVSRIKKDFKEEVKYVRTRMGGRGKFFIDIPKVPNFDKAIRAWRQENGREIHNWASHHMAAMRYFEANIQVLERKKAKNQRGSTSMPGAADDQPDRQREREEELVASRTKHPLKGNGGIILIQGGEQHDPQEIIGDLGAEDSPLRTSGSRSMMGSEDEWRDTFGGGLHRH